MRKLPGLFTLATAVAVLSGVNVASATPPSGQFSYTEHGRGQQAANATLTIPAADNDSSSYTVAPGGDSGWRTTTGDAVLAVTKGALALDQAPGCASQDVAAGKAVVIPTGKFRVRNPGSQPAEFNGIFFNLSAGGPSPLVQGEAEPAPACQGISATAAAPSGVSVADAARGATDPYLHGAQGHGVDSHGTVVHELRAGMDIAVFTYALEPGFSTGWLIHTDEMAIITKGKIAIWEARDGACKKVEEYSPGQAWAHKPHKHMATNDGNETAVVRIIGFNMKHGAPLPVFGSNLDHIDFSQAPPADCPRLR
jgi:mannose-6-phosphate isomerase-like protein (cupin superfamily)